MAGRHRLYHQVISNVFIFRCLPTVMATLNYKLPFMTANRLNFYRSFVESLETNDDSFKQAVLEGLYAVMDSIYTKPADTKQ